MAFDPVKGHETYASWVIDHCEQVSLKSVKAARRYIRFNMWLTEERKKEQDMTVPFARARAKLGGSIR